MSTETRSELDQLAEQAEQARAAFDAANAKANAARAAAEQRRTKAHEQFDRQTADFDDAPYAAEIDAARAELTAALLADPVRQAMIRVNAAELIRARATSAAVAAAAKVGVETTSAEYRPRLVGWDEIDRMAEAEVGRRAADVDEVRDQARFDAGEKAAARRT